MVCFTVGLLITCSSYTLHNEGGKGSCRGGGGCKKFKNNMHDLIGQRDSDRPVALSILTCFWRDAKLFGGILTDLPVSLL